MLWIFFLLLLFFFFWIQLESMLKNIIGNKIIYSINNIIVNTKNMGYNLNHLLPKYY